MANGSVVGYNLESIAAYIILTGSNVEPTTRKPFLPVELSRMDRQVKANGLQFDSVYEAVFSVKKQLQRVMEEKAVETFESVLEDAGEDFAVLLALLNSPSTEVRVISNYIIPSVRENVLVAAIMHRQRTLQFVETRYNELERSPFRHDSIRNTILTALRTITTDIHQLSIGNASAHIISAMNDIDNEVEEVHSIDEFLERLQTRVDDTLDQLTVTMNVQEMEE